MRANKLLEHGISAVTDIDTRRHIVLSNLVYIVIGSILLVYVLITSPMRPIFSGAAWIPLVLILAAGVSFLLNAGGLHLLSRVLFVINWFVWVSIVPVVLYGPSPSSYYTSITYFVVFSPAIQLFFSMRKEGAYLIVFMTASFVFTFFYFDFLIAFDRSPNPGFPLAKSMLGMKINYLTVWAFLNLLMMYVLRVNRSFYAEINHQKEIIEKQQLELKQSYEELAARNNELTVANHELTCLNEQVRHMNHELEDRVSERTRELVERNERLTEYTFMNAHLLRSPVSRIKGLINLFGITKEAKEKEQVQSLLSATADELDTVIHTISDRLNNKA